MIADKYLDYVQYITQAIEWFQRLIFIWHILFHTGKCGSTVNILDSAVVKKIYVLWDKETWQKCLTLQPEWALTKISPYISYYNLHNQITYLTVSSGRRKIVEDNCFYTDDVC
jgi:hypothetical protein